jgi:hypothetical protein
LLFDRKVQYFRWSCCITCRIEEVSWVRKNGTWGGRGCKGIKFVKFVTFHSSYKGQNLRMTAHLRVMLWLRMSGPMSPLPIFLCGLYMDNLACASIFICHSENSSCPGTGSRLLVHCPIAYFLSIHCVPMFCSRLTSSTLKLEEAASSKILVPVYQITGHHVSEDHSINNQWADTQMVSAYLLFCFVINYNIFDCRYGT